MLSIKKLFSIILVILLYINIVAAEETGFVAVADLDMMILPGTQSHMEQTIEQAIKDGAKAVVFKLDTPGGILDTSQQMIQGIFKSKIPVFIYVAPTGATATSAGVFITMAGHIAAMAPGTSIGAAHPVTGEGKDIEGDMRAKAENMTIAMVKSITDQRGRNLEWAEKAVKESNSITEKEALEKKVVDFIATDINDLLRQAAGKEITIDDKKIKMADLSKLPLKEYELSLKNKSINFISHPNIAALLWLGATTGLSIEMYNPGAILPGVVGVICLILAITAMQILPVTQTGVILMGVGAVLIVMELFFTSGALLIGGLIAIILGAFWLIDPSQAPGLQVSLTALLPVAFIMMGFLLWVMREVVASRNSKVTTAGAGLIGLTAKAAKDFSEEELVFVNGEFWKARLIKGEKSLIKKDSKLKVVKVDGLTLEVE